MKNAVRLALSGSGFKFPAHVGVLLALRDAGLTPIEYAGTSGGSIVAALAASGMPLEVMRDLTLTNDWSPMLRWNPLAMFGGGYCNGDNLEAWIEAHTQGLAFRALPVDLTIVASDVVTETPYIFNKQTTPTLPISRAARASASIPIVFSPITQEKALLMDGGMEDNIPADLLVKDDALRLGVQLVSSATPYPVGDRRLTSIVPRLLDLMLTATENAHRAIAQNSGVDFIYIETGYAGSLDRDMPLAIRQRLFDDGYAAAKNYCKSKNLGN